jgi:glycerate kinase
VRILIAPDKFKGALSARQAGEAIASGLREILPDAKIEVVPMADGGEGTVEVISQAIGISSVKCDAHDALGGKIEARYGYGWNDDRQLALIEMSESAGMWRLIPDELDPERASTFGVGEMIINATERGVAAIVIGLGGSATNDGGTGMARAIGFRFVREDGSEIKSVFDLASLERVESPNDLKLPRTILAAGDVRNPLLGENGATRVFGPQKGVIANNIEKFERALEKLADVVAKQFGCDRRNEPGAGAAGGLGFGLMSFCGAKIQPGFEVVADFVRLESKMKEADVVITGEGSLDRQTLEGKTPAGVANLARKLGKPVFAFVGRDNGNPEAGALFDGVYQNARPGMSTEENMKRAAEILRDNARLLAEELKKTPGH